MGDRRERWRLCVCYEQVVKHQLAITRRGCDQFALDCSRILKLVLVWLGLWGVAGAQPSLPRCEVLPLPGHRVSLRVDGEERVGWHFGSTYERPFFFPLRGPQGGRLTRIGHPGAENHDHHRSVWFAHADVEGNNFWANTSPARIRQKHWYAYQDGEDQAIMSVRLGWFDGQGREVMDSDLLAAFRPRSDGQYTLELQLTCRPPEGSQSVTLGRTNFGFLAVRVAKSLSVHFGGGRITSSEGQIGESAIFGQRARWMDYSGRIASGRGSDRREMAAGITYFSHPSNLRYPPAWHVREDGWMGASFCRQQGHVIQRSLTLRYLLHVHRDAYDADVASELATEFAAEMPLRVQKSAQPHRQYEVVRVPSR